MMQKKFFPVLICFFVINNCSSQPIFKTSTFSCSEFNIIQNGLGGYFEALHRIVGGLSRVTLINTDSVCNVQWVREFCMPEIVAPTNAKRTYDGSFIVVNKLLYNLNDNYLAYLIKMDMNGDTVWTKVYAEPGCDIILTSVEECPDHGFIFFGSKTNPTRLFIMKTDEFGNLLFKKNFFDPNPGFTLVDGIVTSDSGFAMTGGKWGLIKMDASANVQWVEPLVFDTFSNTNRQLVEAANHSIVLIGTDDVAVPNQYDPFIFRYSLTGTLMSSTTLTSLSGITIWEAIKSNDDGLVFSGKLSIGGGHFVPYLIKLDSTLNPAWGYTYQADSAPAQYGGFGSLAAIPGQGYVADGFHKIYQTLPPHIIATTGEDGMNCSAQILAIGPIQNFIPAYHTTMLTDTIGGLLKQDPDNIVILTHSPTFTDFCLSTNLEEQDHNQIASFISADESSWKIHLNHIPFSHLVIYDSNGKMVFEGQVTDGKEINSGSFTNGIYFWRMQYEDFSQSGKVLK
ncbi:MAG: T9SS type A sorting domain-containing protein [Bacteroidota bacterium]